MHTCVTRWTRLWWLHCCYGVTWPGARPTNGISIDFKIRLKFRVFWFKMCSTDHKESVHMHDATVLLSWHVLSFVIIGRIFYDQEHYKWKLNWILNPIEISLVGRTPGFCSLTQIARFVWPTWGPPGSWRPQVGPTLAPWILLWGLRCISHEMPAKGERLQLIWSITDRLDWLTYAN